MTIIAKSFLLGKQFSTAITYHTRRDRKGEVHSLGNNLTKEQMCDSRQTCFGSLMIIREHMTDSGNSSENLFQKEKSRPRWDGDAQ